MLELVPGNNLLIIVTTAPATTPDRHLSLAAAANLLFSHRPPLFPTMLFLMLFLIPILMRGHSMVKASGRRTDGEEETWPSYSAFQPYPLRSRAHILSMAIGRFRA